MIEDDLYRTLGVRSTASLEDIKRSFRRLAKRFHPDRNPGNRGAEQQFKQIAAAYDILRDPAKRHEYDARRELQRAGHARSRGQNAASHEGTGADNSVGGEREWFVMLGGRAFGPFTRRRLSDALRSGRIRPRARVRRKGREHWTAIADTAAFREEARTFLRNRRTIRCPNRRCRYSWFVAASDLPGLQRCPACGSLIRPRGDPISRQSQSEAQVRGPRWNLSRYLRISLIGLVVIVPILAAIFNSCGEYRQRRLHGWIHARIPWSPIAYEQFLQSLEKLPGREIVLYETDEAGNRATLRIGKSVYGPVYLRKSGHGTDFTVYADDIGVPTHVREEGKERPIRGEDVDRMLPLWVRGVQKAMMEAGTERQ